MCNTALLSPSSVGVLNLKFFLRGFPELRPWMLRPSSQVYLWYLCEVGHGRIPAFILIPTWVLNPVKFWFPHSPPLVSPTCAAGDWLALLASSSTTPGLYVALTEPWAPGPSLGEGCSGIPHVLLGPPWTPTWWRSRTDPYPSLEAGTAILTFRAARAAPWTGQWRVLTVHCNPNFPVPFPGPSDAGRGVGLK